MFPQNTFISSCLATASRRFASSMSAMTIRNRMVEEKKKIAANQIIAPRMYVYPFYRGVDAQHSSPEGARQIVDEWHDEGVDGVKITGKPGLWPDVFKAIADEARKNGMGVAVHIGQDGVYPMNAVQIAADGASTIEHHYGYAESSFDNKNIQDLPPDYNYSVEPDRFLETGRVWLQANVQRLHTRRDQFAARYHAPHRLHHGADV